MNITENELKEKVEKTKKTPQRPTKNTDVEFDGLNQKPTRSQRIEDKKNSKEFEKDAYKLEAKIVEELNKKHAVVHTDQFYILTEKFDPTTKGINFSLESKQSFLNTYENQIVQLPEAKRPTTKGLIWIKHQNRRQYEGIIFHPNPKEIGKNYYNIFRGFAIKEHPGTCELFKAHVKNVICNCNRQYFEYVWKWCARMIQEPHKVAETALVLRGFQGVGKNTFVDALGVILGGHFLPLDNIDQFLGRFNYHMKNAVLIHGNEAIWGGNKKQLGTLKAMITEKHRVIEGKNKDAIVVSNFTHLILSSNEDWPVHLDRDDRRFLVLEVSDKHKEDIPYFGAIRKELENGGHAALLYELLNEDISRFDPRILPQNVESFELKLESAPTTERYIYEALKAGGFDVGNLGQQGKWEDDSKEYEVHKAAVYLDYSSWCSYQKLSTQPENTLGKAIKKLIPSVDAGKRSHRDEGRKPMYAFPNLKKARSEFEKAYKVQGASKIWK